MKRPQLFLAAFCGLVLALVYARPAQALLQTLQTQVGVTILVDVVAPTPTPVAYVPQRAPVEGEQPVIADVSLKRMLPGQRAFRAEAIQFTGNTWTIAQAQVQHSLLVQSEVTPNPKATLLYTNNPSVGPYTITSGTTQVEKCAFEVVVDAAKAWTLDEGISQDFSAAFPGKDVGNNTYLSAATPKPTATPYIVYADDGNAWSTLSTGGIGMTTYCVDLTITVPAAVTAGPYTTNAVYTIYQ
jgi:hypothetical protein